MELSDPTKIQLFHTASLPIVLHQTLDENDAPPPLKYLPLQFFTDVVSYLVEDVLHVLSALESPNAVDEAAVLKL